MSTSTTDKADRQLWGIYYTDRKYSRLLGDPLRTVIEAPTKSAAEKIVGKLGFESPCADPVTPNQAEHALWLPERKRQRRQIPVRKPSHSNHV